MHVAAIGLVAVQESWLRPIVSLTEITIFPPRIAGREGAEKSRPQAKSVGRDDLIPQNPPQPNGLEMKNLFYFNATTPRCNPNIWHTRVGNGFGRPTRRWPEPRECRHARCCTRLSRGSLLLKAPTLTRAAISERVTQTAESISSGDALCYPLHPVENSSATGEKSWTNGGNPRSGRCSNSATQSVDVLWAALGGPATGLIPLPFNNESRSLSNRGDLFCVCFAWLRCDCLVFPQSRSSGDRRCA